MQELWWRRSWSRMDWDEEAPAEKTLKIVVCGDGASGKTSLCMRFVQDAFGRQYQQVVYSWSTIVSLCKAESVGSFSIPRQGYQEGCRRLLYITHEEEVVTRSGVAKIFLKWANQAFFSLGEGVPSKLWGRGRGRREGRGGFWQNFRDGTLLATLE